MREAGEPILTRESEPTEATSLLVTWLSTMTTSESDLHAMCKARGHPM